MLAWRQVARQADVRFPPITAQMRQKCELPADAVDARRQFVAIQPGAGGFKAATQAFGWISVENSSAIKTVFDTQDGRRRTGSARRMRRDTPG